MHQKIILLIQGPINSIERSNKFNYDSIKNIKEIVEKNKNIEKIILSIWENENIPDYIKRQKKIIVIKNKLINYPVSLDDHGIIHDGGCRQIETLYNALTYLEDNSMVIKIRTDLYIDLDLVISEINKKNNGKNLIFLGGKFFWLDDVLFSAQGDIFKSFVKNLKVFQNQKYSIHKKFYEAYLNMNNLNGNLEFSTDSINFFSKKITNLIKLRDKKNQLAKIKLYGSYFILKKMMHSTKLSAIIYLFTLKIYEEFKEKFYKN